MVVSDAPERVEIVEVGPRDGLQNEATVLPTADKVTLVRRAVAAGVRRVEAASFVNPRLVPQMADAEAVLAAVRAAAPASGPHPGQQVRLIGLVLNRRGLERAVAAGVDEVNVVVAASEEFSRRNQGAGIAEVVGSVAGIAASARAAGLGVGVTVSTAFGCPFEGEVGRAGVLDVVRRCLDAGVDELALADTIGVGVPGQVRDLFGAVRGLDPVVRLRAHFHNTRNTGYANALAAVEAGVRVLDASVGGIGGCPFAPNATGNIATEDLVYLLHRSGWDTGIDLAAMAATGNWVGELLGRQVPALLGRAGGFPPQ